jgi:serine/threonine-protein kinase HipA
MSECEAFGLTAQVAAEEVMRVIQVVNNWQTHFAKVGVCQEDIDSLALRIDGEFLQSQRSSFDIATYQI